MLIKQKKELWVLFSVSHIIRIIQLFFLMTVRMILEIFGVALIIGDHQLSTLENCDLIIQFNKDKKEPIGTT